MTDGSEGGWLTSLQSEFADRIQTEADLAPFTSSRIGGKADALLEVHDAGELMLAIQALWSAGSPFRVLGGGSNVLVADDGVRELVILNRAKHIQFQEEEAQVRAESGAALGSLARRASERGLRGLEWAVSVPGTVGGAVFGNAGAHNGDTAGTLESAEILHRDEGKQVWPNSRFEFAYRESWLKKHPGKAYVLSAIFKLKAGSTQESKAQIDSFIAHRRDTQPPGASWGSMFKNPMGDFAGRLIEAVGMKGHKVGDAQISEKHANFFINLGTATAEDVIELIEATRKKVLDEFSIALELEIELVGAWPEETLRRLQNVEPLE